MGFAARCRPLIVAACDKKQLKLDSRVIGACCSGCF